MLLFSPMVERFENNISSQEDSSGGNEIIHNIFGPNQEWISVRDGDFSEINIPNDDGKMEDHYLDEVRHLVQEAGGKEEDLTIVNRRGRKIGGVVTTSFTIENKILNRIRESMKDDISDIAA